MKTKKMREDELKKIVERIRDRRKELDLSFQQLADKTGLSSSTLQRYETGKIQNIPVDKVKVLARGLDVSPAYIMGWEDENEYDPLKDANLEKVEEIYHFPKGSLELIHLYNALDPSYQRQVIDYVKFLLNQNGNLSEDK